MRSTLRLLAIAAVLVVVATRLFAAQAEISGIERVYLRAGPGSDQPTLGVLSAGDPVDIIDIEGSWTKIQTADGKVGYVYHRYVTAKVIDQSGANPAPPVEKPVAPLPGEPARPPVAPAMNPPVAPPAGSRAAGPPPVAAPAPGAPVPSGERPHGTELSSELATLRAEIADLKQKVQERQAEVAGEPSAPGAQTAIDPLAAPSEPMTTPSTPAPISGRDQAVGVLMIALFSLVIGWVLGSTFGGRRGPRSRGGRLRF